MIYNQVTDDLLFTLIGFGIYLFYFILFARQISRHNDFLSSHNGFEFYFFSG